ncbi:hypothetical protein COCCADRAFT_90589 [Bipolaris zeicola 26-R-13]|uniref:Uncharacterized protein n=1 Tax=Cochliobolus carbonum (strain 26-R-13) TaxID=930089 RepID=W6Y7F4_COCC2|nr:uncharacterized protein COCCADRAFT_90589 [Bipolaris zeicola 26-R-13]EUC35552.1 hypothetical protein COCCADRAFT_90589 [Bipolaris zeicola 26-R-13]
MGIILGIILVYAFLTSTLSPPPTFKADPQFPSPPPNLPRNSELGACISAL